MISDIHTANQLCELSIHVSGLKFTLGSAYLDFFKISMWQASIGHSLPSDPIQSNPNHNLHSKNLHHKKTCTHNLSRRGNLSSEAPKQQRQKISSNGNHGDIHHHSWSRSYLFSSLSIFTKTLPFFWIYQVPSLPKEPIELEAFFGWKVHLVSKFHYL